MRKVWMILVVALLALPAVAGTVDSFIGGSGEFTSGNDLVINGGNYFNTDSGWFRNTGVHNAGNTNYIAGYCDNCGGYYYHDYFSFDLSGLTGPVTTASFTVDTYVIQYDPGTFLLYGTSLAPANVDSSQNWTDVAKYDALISGPLVGSISLTPGDSNTNVTATFNASGIAWLNSNLRGEVVLGGDFSESQVPEPGSLMLLLLGTGVISLAGAIRRVRG